MRMWNVPTNVLCRRHLLGEHLEMHMFAGTILKKISIKGYVEKGLVEVHNIAKRHQELVDEMIKRGIKHQSELQSFESWVEGKVNVEENLKTLKSRCTLCRIGDAS